MIDSIAIRYKISNACKEMRWQFEDKCRSESSAGVRTLVDLGLTQDSLYLTRDHPRSANCPIEMVVSAIIISTIPNMLNTL